MQRTLRHLEPCCGLSWCLLTSLRRKEAKRLGRPEGLRRLTVQGAATGASRGSGRCVSWIGFFWKHRVGVQERMAQGTGKTLVKVARGQLL